MAKNYVGSGKKHEKYDGIVKVTIDMEKAKPFIYDFKGKKYLTVDVAAMKQANEHGKTHSVSVWTKEEGQQSSQIDDSIPF